MRSAKFCFLFRNAGCLCSRTQDFCVQERRTFAFKNAGYLCSRTQNVVFCERVFKNAVQNAQNAVFLERVFLIS